MLETIDGPLESEQNEHEMLCNWQDRVRHMFIDFIVIGLLMYLINDFIYEIARESAFLTFITIGFLYYFLSEVMFKTTLGKIVNRTKIVYLNEHSSKLLLTIVRSIVRIIPFSFITYFTLYNAPLHDLLSKTYLVRIKKN